MYGAVCDWSIMAIDQSHAALRVSATNGNAGRVVQLGLGRAGVCLSE